LPFPTKTCSRISNPMFDEIIDFEPLINPESDFEAMLISTPEFREGFNWGTPRFGHPEGKVGLHVREVLENVRRLDTDVVTYHQLRIVALAHDTFKNKEFRFGKRLRHHGLLARDFMEQHLQDANLLDVIELHDEAFYIWRMQTLEKRLDEAQQRLENLLTRLGGSLPLYYLFYKCDTQTGDKIQAPLYWFEHLMKEMEVIV
jgi:hypothetical protein